MLKPLPRHCPEFGVDDGKQLVVGRNLALVRAAAESYSEFELPIMLLTTDQHTAGVLVEQGAQPVQDYSRSVWLRSGYAAWYGHVDGFYARVMAAANRRRNAPINEVAL